ncbi:MAG TPA: GNAT family N-acetyltransferase [Fimbriimonadaceae bacterium]|nr:GNAT family N-acetyltransferase [Fimbriimonadaceae bacterium]
MSDGVRVSQSVSELPVDLIEDAEAAYILGTGAHSAQAMGDDSETESLDGAVVSCFRRERSSLYNRAFRVASVEQASEAIRWFRRRNIPCRIDLAPSYHPDVPHSLEMAGFRSIPHFNYTNGVIAGPIPSMHQVHESVRDGTPDEVARIQRGVWEELETWGSGVEEYYRLLSGDPHVSSLVALVDGRPAATGALWVHGLVAYFFGGAALPEARRLGLHRTLLESRLARARDRGCRWASALVHPGSQSHRNCESAGLPLAFRREVWMEADWADHPFYSEGDGDAGLAL